MRKGPPGEEKEGSAEGAPCVQDVGGGTLAGVWKLGADEKSHDESEAREAKRFQGSETVAEGRAGHQVEAVKMEGDGGFRMRFVGRITGI